MVFSKDDLAVIWTSFAAGACCVYEKRPINGAICNFATSVNYAVTSLSTYNSLSHIIRYEKY